MALMVANVSTNPVMDTNLRERRRYRSWPEALKREIVAATFEPGASVAAVALRYEVNANQVFTWRRRFGPSGIDVIAPGLMPVVLTGEAAPLAASISPDDRIEIELAGGYRVRVGGDAAAAMLRRVLDVLERR
ncbi:Transposase and inactivated derivative [Paramagnetospirillum magneticum AMB-1]|uniref:Transposase and inactivated derivative n=1 Tax=Paramagnetospirillum magneticum (strain ATCC 700264 / AMB-1) TaxID=342108 RepID=Q2W1Z4_PARM1|nr:Transposase and inactivated derivative [Paramagnetospirillum magneticum AMB-1]